MATGTIENTIKKTTLNPSFTKSSGSGTAHYIDAKRIGNIIEAHFKVKNSSGSGINAGTNVIAGTVSDLPLPSDYAESCAYNGTCCLVGSLGADGSLICRATGGTFGNNAEGVMQFIYIV